MVQSVGSEGSAAEDNLHSNNAAEAGGGVGVAKVLEGGPKEVLGIRTGSHHQPSTQSLHIDSPVALKIVLHDRRGSRRVECPLKCWMDSGHERNSGCEPRKRKL